MLSSKIQTTILTVFIAAIAADSRPLPAQIRLRALRNFENHLEQKAESHLQDRPQQEQGVVTTFSAAKLQKLRFLAAKRVEVPKDMPNGWSKSKVDPARLLDVFAPLRLKQGVVLRAYQFKEGGNGNGVVWAMPANAAFPEPNQCPKVQRRDGFLKVPRPPAALPSIMEQIEGDGSAWSYMAASLLSREFWEFGAMWHGANWGTFRIVDGSLWKAEMSDGSDPMSHPKTAEANWKWLDPKPRHWRPRVTVYRDKVVVIFYTYSGYQKEAIYRHTDTYRRGSYRYESERKEIAHGAKGYVF